MTGTGPTTVTGEEWYQVVEANDELDEPGYEPMFQWFGAEVVYVVFRDGQVNRKEHFVTEEGRSVGFGSRIVREPIENDE